MELENYSKKFEPQSNVQIEICPELSSDGHEHTEETKSQNPHSDAHGRSRSKCPTMKQSGTSEKGTKSTFSTSCVYEWHSALLDVVRKLSHITPLGQGQPLMVKYMSCLRMNQRETIDPRISAKSIRYVSNT